MTEEEKKILDERRAEEAKRSCDYAAARFDIPRDQVVAWNSGICYDKIWVTTEVAARKVSAAVKHETVNGGWYDGMPLGNVSFYDGTWEVMC